MENQNTPALMPQETSLSVFHSSNSFENAQRMAKALSSSTVVPKDYQNNVPNCIVALEMANRIGVSPIMVMQNMNVIHGKPSWNSTFIISAINTCGRFSQPLQFKLTGTGDERTCIAYTFDKNGNLVEGTPVSIKMAKSEGWFNKPGSKWPSMPEQMLRYRAASFFGRLFCPEILLGMHSADEVLDSVHQEVRNEKSAVNEILIKASATPVNENDPIIDDEPPISDDEPPADI